MFIHKNAHVNIDFEMASMLSTKRWVNVLVADELPHYMNGLMTECSGNREIR